MSDLIQTMKEHLAGLSGQLRGCPRPDTVADIRFELDRLLEDADVTGARLGRPVVVALVGGTGVGKSSLFNQLVGQAFSPVAVERACTSKPIVALPPQAKPYLAALLEDSAPPLEISQADVALVDTPDLDSFLAEHQELARRVIERADVIVMVSNPTKWANEAGWQILRQWGERKRWFFVLNQADLLGDVAASLSEYIRLLREGGFPADERVVFATDALRPDTLDFWRLKRTICSQRATAQIESLRRDAFLSRVLYAIEEPRIQRLEKNIDTFRGQTRQAAATMRTALEKAWLALRSRLNAPGFFLEQLVWTAIGRAGTGLLAPCIWLRNLMAGGTRLASWSGLLGWGGRRKDDAAPRGLRWLPDDSGEWRTAFRDARDLLRRQAEDLSLSERLVQEPDQEQEIALDETDIERMASASARAVAAWPWIILAHLPPAAATIYSFWRMAHDYLTLGIFREGAVSSYLFVLALSLLPGYALLKIRMRFRLARLKRNDFKELVIRAMTSDLLAPWDDLLRRWEAAILGMHDVRREAMMLRAVERGKLHADTFGITPEPEAPHES